ncbi:glycosyltransferase family 4 protein [Nocardioides jishulii]|uniref:Glycosyltransferase family 4 protein n=1 Tax=Nocardioides jishulii TaxID=2575440 RepID=A0A4U2YSG0_9ACTN|nr:glycosyltransferase family 4 protein [Nocardioides jishulii]QCX26479.1 glycosyltransferase family 4 protein [Nocardioides jishulii]TKI63715.1 glycosyltransferase family 4 protein [Nocardioides jishulii]
MSDLPRLLHVGYRPIGNPDNTGLTLASMFESWPDSHLLQVFSKDASGPSVRRGGYELPSTTYPLEHWGRRVLGADVRGVADGMNSSVARTGRVPLKTRIKLVAMVLNDIAPVVLPKDLDDVVAEYRPEVLHSLLGSVREMSVALAIAKRYDLPILPHYMDDWPVNLHQASPFRGIARRRVERTHRAILERSPVGLGIGFKMAEEFTSRYGRPFTPVGNSVPADDLLGATGSVAHERGVMRYVGGLHLGRDRVVSVVAEELARHENTAGWSIEIFRPGHSAAAAATLAARHGNVIDRGEVEAAKVADVLQTASCLLFIESEDEGVVPFTRYSVSTKVPEYVASRRPVVCVGPVEQGSIEAFARSTRSVALQLRQPDWEGLVRFLGTVDDPMPPDVGPRVLEEFSREATHRRLAAAARAARDAR